MNAHRFSLLRHGLILLALCVPLARPATAACSAAPCSSPSQTQAEALFARIELFYPSLFLPATATQNTRIGSDTAYFRYYGTPTTTGLATYQGGLWYYMAGNWNRYASLDDANQLFCNGACWSGRSTAQFNMAQTLSDEAQRTTLAFSGLAMMTGNLQAQSFFPPGKVADYTGFQYLRDNDPDNMGHNTSFLTRVANNVLYILSDSQLTQLKTLASSQLSQINLYGYQRYPLMAAFRRTIDGSVPAGSSGLNLNAVRQASRSLYVLDGQISFDRAVAYAAILRSLTTQQKTYLDAMKGRGWSSWPNVTDDQVRSRLSNLPQGTMVAVMTYASDLFSWYAGSLEADVYFCPERHGTYFGSFYIKDAPAIGHEGYSIDEQLTATAGAALSDAGKGYVTTSQATLMSSLVDAQRGNLYAMVTLRTEIAQLLRSLLTGAGSTDAIRTQVLALSASYGELDGANNHAYANIFAQVYRTLSASQKTRLADLRKAIMSGRYADGTAFDYSISSTYYLYSEAITDTSLLTPYIGNTDYLFFEPR